MVCITKLGLACIPKLGLVHISRTWIGHISKIWTGTRASCHPLHSCWSACKNWNVHTTSFMHMHNLYPKLWVPTWRYLVVDIILIVWSFVKKACPRLRVFSKFNRSFLFHLATCAIKIYVNMFSWSIILCDLWSLILQFTQIKEQWNYGVHTSWKFNRV